jgi:uncharacterized protein DUF7007
MLKTVSQSLHNMLNYAKVIPQARKQGAVMPGGMHTPWGKAQTQRQLADGVFWVETEAHGGLLIENVRAEECLSEKALALGKRWHDFLAFEQDKDMMVVFYEYPAWYPWMEEELTEQFAEESLRRDHPDYFA